MEYFRKHMLLLMELKKMKKELKKMKLGKNGSSSTITFQKRDIKALIKTNIKDHPYLKQHQKIIKVIKTL